MTATETAGIVIETQDYTESAKVDASPKLVRWGFNPTQRDKILNAQECGVAQVPFARLFPIRTFISPREQHTIDWTLPKEIDKTITAAEAQAVFEEALGGQSTQNTTNWGFKCGFAGETDGGKMAVLTHTLLPSLSGIREICQDYGLEQPIADVCEGEDELDFGGRETCISCWMKWLKSAAAVHFYTLIAESGMEISEHDRHEPETLRTRLVKPTIAEFETAHRLIVEAFQTGLPALQRQWGQIAKELSEEKGARKDVSDFEHTYRKDLHQPKPEDRQLNMARTNAAELVKAINVKGTGHEELMQMLAQSQMQTNQLLQQVLEKQQTVKTASPKAKESEK